MLGSCGFRDENNDICGETFTCGDCRKTMSDDERMNLLSSQIADLQEVVRLLVFHIGNKLTDPEAQEELDQVTLGTPMQRR